MQPTTINNFVPENKVAALKEVVRNRIKYDINLKSQEFEQVVKMLVDEYDFDEIVETGAFDGLGSTSVFAKTGKYVFSIECNKQNFDTATRNLQQYENVCVIHGLSLFRELLINSLLHQEFDIETTYDSDFPKSFYMREINQQVVVENALDIFCNNDRKQLVFLDSAGGVGYVEFLEFMNYINDEGKYNKILILDDIDHIKHKRSVEYLEIRGYQVFKSKENRFAWCDLSKGKLKKENETDILSEQPTEIG